MRLSRPPADERGRTIAGCRRGRCRIVRVTAVSLRAQNGVYESNSSFMTGRRLRLTAPAYG